MSSDFRSKIQELKAKKPRLQHYNRSHKRGACYSNFIGVSWDRRLQKWQAMIKDGPMPIKLGYFDNEIDAARARDGAAIALFGPEAHLNLPDTDPIPYPRRQDIGSDD